MGAERAPLVDTHTLAGAAQLVVAALRDELSQGRPTDVAAV